jgi:hypothetical protein
VRGRGTYAGLAIVMSLLAGCTASNRNDHPTQLPNLSSHPESPSSTSTTPTTAASSTPSTTAAAIANDIKVYGNCTTPSVEPREIVLTCADYGELLERLHWTSWTSDSATAVGTLVYNDCTPDCADGHSHDVPGTRVTLTDPVRTVRGQIVWSKVQEDPEPPGYETGPFHGGPQPLPTQPA